MKRLIYTLLTSSCIGLIALLAGPADDRHRANPDSDGRAPRSVSQQQYYIPKVGDSIDDPRLRFTGWGQKRFALGRAKCTGYLVDAVTDREKITESKDYNAWVYATRKFELNTPIKNVTYWNNNPGAWRWERGDIYSFMVCYTDRGMITLPDMPQKGMKLITPP